MKKLVLIFTLLFTANSMAYKEPGWTLDTSPEIVIPIIVGTSTAVLATAVSIGIGVVGSIPEAWVPVALGTTIVAEVFAVMGGVTALSGLIIGGAQELQFITS